MLKVSGNVLKWNLVRKYFFVTEITFKRYL